MVRPVRRGQWRSGRADGNVSLSTGRGPLSARPAGRFSAPVPAEVAYIEPFRRRVRATKDGRNVVDSERALLVHRLGLAAVLRLPRGGRHGLAVEPEPDTPGYVTVAWDAADAWFEEDEQVFGHPRNPYHRVDCLRSRAPAAGRGRRPHARRHDRDTGRSTRRRSNRSLYVDPRLARTDVLEAEHHADLLPLQGHGELLDRPYRGRRPRRHRLEL